MAIEVFNRYEQKYILDEKTYKKVKEIIEEHMELDTYNKDNQSYTIANIYFDTADDILIRRSLEKPKYKEKLRLRAYGVPNGQSDVYLEIKKKFDGIVNKRRTTLKLKEAYDFIRTGNMPNKKKYMNVQVLKEIDYFLKCYNLKPKVYVAYDRIAYFEKNNNDLRISFDRNIRTRRYDLGLEQGDFGKMLLGEGVYLMEIKTLQAFPMWICDMLTQFNIVRASFSKYGEEFKRFQLNNKKMGCVS